MASRAAATAAAAAWFRVEVGTGGFWGALSVESATESGGDELGLWGDITAWIEG